MKINLKAVLLGLTGIAIVFTLTSFTLAILGGDRGSSIVREAAPPPASAPASPAAPSAPSNPTVPAAPSAPEPAPPAPR